MRVGASTGTRSDMSQVRNAAKRHLTQRCQAKDSKSLYRSKQVDKSSTVMRKCNQLVNRGQNKRWPCVESNPLELSISAVFEMSTSLGSTQTLAVKTKASNQRKKRRKRRRRSGPLMSKISSLRSRKTANTKTISSTLSARSKISQSKTCSAYSSTT
jgi:hypothetical protein